MILFTNKKLLLVIMSDILYLMPEIIMFIGTLLIKTASVFFKDRGSIVRVLSVSLLIFTATILIRNDFTFSSETFSFSTNAIGCYAKITIIIISAFNLLLLDDAIKYQKEYNFSEYSLIILFATLGMMMTISASDFLMLFLSLEMQALCQYILASYYRNNILSSEAGLKYFILGSMMSCIMLFGISLIYGFTGSIYYNEIISYLGEHNNSAINLGFILLATGLLFKLSIAPLHIWTPDVYEGSPLVATIFFATNSKLPILFVFIKIYHSIAPNLFNMCVDLCSIGFIGSALVGAIGAIGQQSIKRLFAYSTILNMSFVLLALVSENGPKIAIIYILTYSISMIGVGSLLYSLLGKNAEYAKISDLAGAYNFCSYRSCMIAVIFFSFIGLPPFIGFATKFYVLKTAIASGFYLLSLCAIIASSIACYYYLNILRIMYFETTIEGHSFSSCSLINFAIGLTVSLIVILGFFAPSLFLDNLSKISGY
jgi:NADH-quinone oxidoreductase subunit N